MIRQLCKFRLSLHYVNGYGTDVRCQDSADIQASEYFNQCRRNKFCQSIAGLLCSIGRSNAMAVMQPIAESTSASATAISMLDLAIEQNVVPALYWKAKLLFEAWGEQKNVQSASRKSSLKECNDLLSKCENFRFNETTVSDMKEKAKKLLSATHTYANDPQYLLSLYGFGIELKKTVVNNFPAVLKQIIISFASSTNVELVKVSNAPLTQESYATGSTVRICDLNCLFNSHSSLPNTLGVDDGYQSGTSTALKNDLGVIVSTTDFRSDSKIPSVKVAAVRLDKDKSVIIIAVNGLQLISKSLVPLPAPPQDSSVKSNWLLELRDKVLFNSHFISEVAGKGGEKGSSNPQHAFVLNWMKQNFNNLFRPENADDATCPRWTLEHAQALLEKIKSATAKARNVCEEFDYSENPITIATTRLTDAKIAFGNLTEIFTTVHARSKKIFNEIEPILCYLDEQMAFYDCVSSIINSTDQTEMALNCIAVQKVEGAAAAATTSAAKIENAAITVVAVARKLARDSKESDPDITKHIKSAMSLLSYSSKFNISLEKAMSDLNEAARPLLMGKLADKTPASIGYHIIVDSTSIRSYLSELSKDNSGVRTLIEKRATFLEENREINDKWFGSDERSLMHIFNESLAMVEAKMKFWANPASVFSFLGEKKTLTYSKPVANLEALTYADPWSNLTQIDINSALAHHFVKLKELVDMTGLTELEVENQILSQILDDKWKLLTVSREIYEKLNSCPNEVSIVQLKKKMLYLLETAPNYSLDNEESRITISEQLNAGLMGRCADGISSFCDEFILFQGLNQNSSLKSLPPTFARLILAVSRMIISMKAEFIEKHLSREKTAYEGRTVGRIKLNNMLLIPLGLPGTFGQVKYPRYATNGHSDASQMNSSTVLRRYLEGGTIRFTYGEEVKFDELTLANLASRLRSTIVISKLGLDQSVVPETNANLQPRPSSGFSIDQDVIKDFLETDLIIAPYYEQAKSAHFTYPNLFFNDLPEDGAGNSRPHIVQVMKDSCILRIFEVTMYAKLPANFWRDVTNSWHF